MPPPVVAKPILWCESALISASQTNGANSFSRLTESILGGVPSAPIMTPPRRGFLDSRQGVIGDTATDVTPIPIHKDCLPARDSAILHPHNAHPNPANDIGFPGSNNPIPDSGHSIPTDDHCLSHDGNAFPLSDNAFPDNDNRFPDNDNGSGRNFLFLAPWALKMTMNSLLRRAGDPATTSCSHKEIAVAKSGLRAEIGQIPC